MLFRRSKRTIPLLNTASLPDLIFTVLFFFIMVTRMRDVGLKVKYRTPEGKQLTRLVRKSAVTHVYIGQPIPEMQAKYGKTTRIQVNDKFVDMAELIDFVVEERKSMSPEDLQVARVSIKADKKTDVGVIADVREALQRAGALRISYSAETLKDKE